LHPDGKGDDGGRYHLVILTHFPLDLDQASEILDDARGDRQTRPGRYRSRKLHPPKRRQYPTLPLPTPGGDAAQLRHRLHEQKRREITAAGHGQLAGRADPALQGDDPVDEEKRRPVGQMGSGIRIEQDRLRTDRWRSKALPAKMPGAARSLRA